MLVCFFFKPQDRNATDGARTLPPHPRFIAALFPQFSFFASARGARDSILVRVHLKLNAFSILFLSKKISTCVPDFWLFRPIPEMSWDFRWANKQHLASSLLFLFVVYHKRDICHVLLYLFFILYRIDRVLVLLWCRGMVQFGPPASPRCARRTGCSTGPAGWRLGYSKRSQGCSRRFR